MEQGQEGPTMASKSGSSKRVVRDTASGRFAVRVEAARARVVLDKKLGRRTPDSIKELANREQ